MRCSVFFIFFILSLTVQINLPLILYTDNFFVSGQMNKISRGPKVVVFSLYTVGPYIFGHIIATGGSARDVTHSITSIILSFVNKCNNSNSCKLFYLDYKSINGRC